MNNLLRSFSCRIRYFWLDDIEIIHKWSDWEYQESNNCNQVSICRRCKKEKNRLLHNFTDWEYLETNNCNQVRRCIRCKKQESGYSQHIFEDVTKGRRICKRCQRVESQVLCGICNGTGRTGSKCNGDPSSAACPYNLNDSSSPQWCGSCPDQYGDECSECRGNGVLTDWTYTE